MTATASKAPKPNGSEAILSLVQLALDEIDSVPLDASVRRAVRIASLLGDSRTAVRLGLDLRPSGGHPPANKEATKRLMSDPSLWGSISGPAEEALNEYMAVRRKGELHDVHSVAEIEFWQAEVLKPEVLTNQQYTKDLENREWSVRLKNRIKHDVFTLLCGWERQLTFTVNQASALETVSRRVDATLGEYAPDVLDQFNLAFRRLREAASSDLEVLAREALSHALTSCRRILKAVVDIVQPVDPNKPTSAGGHKLSDDLYKNRLAEFLTNTVHSRTFRAALDAEGETLFTRFDTVNDMAHKGVHANVMLEEAEYCALHTYLLAGEILLLHQDEQTAATA
jgi:hypothetical protein